MAEDREENRDKGKISRREFLKDAGLVVGGAAVGSVTVLNSCKGGETTKTVANSTLTKTTTVTAPAGTGVTTITVTPKPMSEVSATAATVKLTVNKQVYELDVEPTETLHEMMREKLGFMSLKEMCTGYGACGSCSLIMNGRPILSCLTLAIECNGVTIETAEGVAKSMPALIDAYVANHCMQCGYCTPGFVVTAKALLDHTPKPTEADIREALGGNICRCGPYPTHIKAVLQAAGIK
jgi:aerobic-type carbon monoxide dehydrogenase small subunit (CoxS/CutS family)